MTVERFNLLRSNILTAMQDAVPSAQTYDHYPVESQNRQVFTKEGRVAVWWIEAMTPNLARNVGGTVGFEGSARLVGVLSIEREPAETQTGIENQAMAILSGITTGLPNVRDGRLIGVRPATHGGRRVFEATVEIVFFTLPALPNA